MNYFKIPDKILNLAQTATEDISSQFSIIDEIAQKNTEKVLLAFQKNRVSDTMFAGSTGYGYDDKGRETLDLVFADIMKTEAALVREGFVSGTHAITAMLFASLRPGQTLLSVAGIPYDTLHGVIGISGNYSGSLRDYGIAYSQIELNEDGLADLKAISAAVRDKNVGAVLIQRSRGYSSRRALSVGEIGEICGCVRAANKSVRIMVDNCYGEFVEAIEPSDVGADIFAGSLIKNPGGGIAPTGGYVAGREDLVRAAANRFTAPGIGDKCGSEQGGHRLLYQGLFIAPHTVAQALKTAVFAARLFELLGYRTHPGYDDKRSDIIQMVELLSPDALLRFCRGIQAAAPIDSYVTPIAAEMPGYEHPVVMAAGTFIQGASIELSADAPMREPYNAFLQGGLTYESGKLGVMLAATHLEELH